MQAGNNYGKRVTTVAELEAGLSSQSVAGGAAGDKATDRSAYDMLAHLVRNATVTNSKPTEQQVSVEATTVSCLIAFKRILFYDLPVHAHVRLTLNQRDDVMFSSHCRVARR